MRLAIILILAIVVVLAPVWLPNAMAFENRTWISTNQGSTNWFSASNWDENSIPTSSDEVIINPANLVGGGAMPIINTTAQDAHAKKLTIQLDGSARGTLTITAQAVLVLGNGNAQTSTIHGDVYLGTDGGGSNYGTLKINGNHIIQGEGGTITMRDFNNTKILENDGTGDYLTLQSSTSCGPDDRDCTVLMHGSAEIHVGLDNRAFVVSDDSCLKLKTDAKTGTSAGYWEVENGAEFHVVTNVTGACAWRILDVDGGQLIVEEDGCVNATGPVTIHAGDLQCYEQFCTTGKLILKSISKGGGLYTDPRIYVVGGKDAKFGSPVTCGACP